MTKADIVDIVAPGIGLQKNVIKEVMDDILSTIADALHRGERIEFRGFGSFSLKLRKPKKARNPGTGAEIFLPERVVPVFKPSRILRDSINLDYKYKSS